MRLRASGASPVALTLLFIPTATALLFGHMPQTGSDRAAIAYAAQAPDDPVSTDSGATTDRTPIEQR